MTKDFLKITIVFFVTLTILFFAYFHNTQYAVSVPVLMYHNVIDSENMKHYSNSKYKKIFISTDKFEKQMNFLKKHNYKALTLEELYDFVQGEKELPPRSVLITFDDGRKNMYQNAYPILKKYNYNAVAFIITDKNKDKTEEYNPLKLQYLSKEELKKGKDVFEYASHTHNMHKKSDNNKSYLICKPASKIKEDIKTSLKHVDKNFFAYPFGSYNKNVIEILKKLGIKAAFTTKKGKVHKHDSLYELKRYGVDERTSDLYFMHIVGYKPTIK